jgi:hypothetical protein
VQIATKIHWLVGVLCEGFEKHFLALLIAIEVEAHRRQQGLVSSSKQRNKGSRELRSFKCSINYDSKGESSSPWYR